MCYGPVYSSVCLSVTVAVNQNAMQTTPQNAKDPGEIQVGCALCRDHPEQESQIHNMK